MTSASYSLQEHNVWHRSWLYTKKHLNFYRIHVLFFTFTPLIAAAIFYASNGATHIAFIDALFLCVSHITVTGLTTVDLSSLTAWQQVILLLLMCIGNPVTVSWLMVYVRRYYFAKKFERIIETHISSRVPSSQVPLTKNWSRFWRRLNLHWTSAREPDLASDGEQVATKVGRVRTDMIRRVEEEPRLVDPSGWVESPHNVVDPSSESHNLQSETVYSLPADGPRDSANTRDNVPPSLDALNSDPNTAHDNAPRVLHVPRSTSFDQTGHSRPQLSRLRSTATAGLDRDRDRPMTAFPASGRDRERYFPRTQTVEFVAPDPDQMHIRGRNLSHGGVGGLHTRKLSRGSNHETSPSRARHTRGSIREMDAASVAHDNLYSDRILPGRTATMQSNRSSVRPSRLRGKEEDFGGFPLPHIIFARLLRRFFPRLQQRLTRTVTMPYTTTIQSQRGGQTTVLGAKPVPYISFDAIVGRNSAFHALTRENLEELGGVEYRALNMLIWIVGVYNICIPLVAFIIVAPYISRPRWREIFYPPMQHRFVAPAWYSVFQVVSAYTNTGSSLVDQSMVPFQKAYPEVLTLPFLILAGNTAFPIFLRFVIWLLSKAVRKTSRANETLHFLLDHPRRCFIYLFPSHQTWFLLTVLFILNFTDWFFFLVLDIGNPQGPSIPLGTRFAVGFLQATAVRAAGFGAVVLSALAPAVKVLYVVMMYVSVYPIAMSVRSTNVYEERSLGVFDDGSDEDAEEAALRERSRARVWGKYLAAHARQQLSFDMWWLALALFLVCIVERANLEDESNATWFNIFAIIFEITSAYGTVGLSLGTPLANYSFCGTFKPLSKLILCAVMLRGKHRGLPVAIDRAVLLPAEFRREEEGEGAELPRSEGGIEEEAVSLGEESKETPESEHLGNDKDEKASHVESGLEAEKVDTKTGFQETRTPGNN